MIRERGKTAFLKRQAMFAQRGDWVVRVWGVMETCDSRYFKSEFEAVEGGN